MVYFTVSVAFAAEPARTTVSCESMYTCAKPAEDMFIFIRKHCDAIRFSAIIIPLKIIVYIDSHHIHVQTIGARIYWLLSIAELLAATYA